MVSLRCYHRRSKGLRDDEHPEQSEARQKELRHRLDAGAPFRAAIVRVNPGQRSPGIREQPELADKVSDTRITIESFDRVTRIRKRSHPSKEPSSFHPAPDRPPARVAESGFVVMRPQGPQERKIRGQSRPSGLSCCRFDGRLVKLIPPCVRTQQD
jgi:hypothetical protein